MNGSANITIIQSNNYTIGKEYTAQSALNDAVFNIAMLNWELCPLVLPRWYNETWSSMDLYTMSPVGDAIAMVISVARLLYKTATPTVFKIEKVTKCTCYNGSVPVIEHLTSGEVQLQLEMLPNLYHS